MVMGQVLRITDDTAMQMGNAVFLVPSSWAICGPHQLLPILTVFVKDGVLRTWLLPGPGLNPPFGISQSLDVRSLEPTVAWAPLGSAGVPVLVPAAP